jgi:dolichol-phosphate mannosyltransferase
MKISIVVPCYNEEIVLEEAKKRLFVALEGCIKAKEISDYEIVFVDDGSTDNSFSVLTGFARDDRKIKIISFSRNFGHQIAITAGIEACEGDAAVIMDADLQDPPEYIPSMIRKWKEGFRVVHMRRKKRLGESAVKVLLAALFYRFINLLSNVKIPMDSGDFKLIDKTVMDYLKQTKEHHKFIRGLVVLAGFDQTIMDYERQPRFAGKPKYSLLRSLRLAIDGIVSFSSYPLKTVTLMGAIGMISSILLFAYALTSKMFFPEKVLPGWTSLLIVFSFFCGLQMFSLGIIGEYVARIYEEVKDRPLYVVKQKINC